MSHDESGEVVYTLEEAEKLLPEVTTLINYVRDQTFSRTNGNGVSHRDQALERFNELGLQVRDPNAGLVDFPGIQGGRKVWLCWVVGEPAIDWWHERDEGFASRKPL